MKNDKMKKNSIILLETERLKLRHLQPADFDELFKLNSDPEVMKYINGGNPETREKVEKFLSGCLKYYEKNPDLGLFAALSKNDNSFLGWVCLKHLDDTDEIEVGYRLHKKFWNRGFATEGARKLVEYGFKNLQLQRIVAVALPENKASIRVMEKCGLTYRRIADHYGFHCVYYSLTKKGWEKLRS